MALIWEFVIISVIILFGINIGLSFESSKLTNNNVLTIPVIFCLSIFFILLLVNNYGVTLNNVINHYISEIIGVMGILTILSGIIAVKNQKHENKSRFKFFTPLLSSLICCFVGIIVTSILLINSTLISIESDIFLTFILLTIIMASYAISKFLKRAERPYILILTNFMILIGLYFIILATFIPNLNSLSSVQMNPLYINSSSSVFFVLIAGLGIFLLGVFLQNRVLYNKKIL